MTSVGRVRRAGEEAVVVVRWWSPVVSVLLVVFYETDMEV